jgi:hypothetical protein
VLLFALWTALRPSPAVSSLRPARTWGWLAVAAAAGLLVDALDAMSVGCATGFALLSCTLARWVRPAVSWMPHVWAGVLTGALAAPCQEAWFALWMPGLPVFVRFFASALPAARLYA